MAKDEAAGGAANEGPSPPEQSEDRPQAAAETDPATAAAPAAAATTAAPPPPPLLVRLLQQVRALSVRNLAAALPLPSSSLSPLSPLPSTYLQVLVPSSSGSGSGSRGADDPWEAVWTSEVARETLNPSWLLLDLGAALRRRRRKQQWAAGAQAGQGQGQGQGQEWEARVCVFMLDGDAEGEEEAAVVEGSAVLVPPVPPIQRTAGQRRGDGPPLLKPAQAPTSTLLAEFVLRASALWVLPPQLPLGRLPLGRLPLPADRACCLLATREGGEGLVVADEVYEALVSAGGVSEGDIGVSSRGGTPTHRREGAGGTMASSFSWGGGARRVDEQWVAELEEDGHLGFFSSSSSASADGDDGGLDHVAKALASLGVEEGEGGVRAWRERAEARREQQKLADEVGRLRAAVAAAEGRLAQEEEGFREEEGLLGVEGDGVRGLMAEWEALDGELAAVAAAAARQEEECRRLAFLLAARRAKLVQELSVIYPITSPHTSTSASNFSIRGLELPLDPCMTSTTTTGSSSNSSNARDDDEHIASALGYTAHLLALLSKYLGVPLRYAPDCRASRSSIRDPAAPILAFSHLASAAAAASLPGAATAAATTTPTSTPTGDPGSSSNEAAAALHFQAAVTFPLYKRGVEKERFEWAVHLLRRNVLQLLSARGVPTSAVVVKGGQWHLLQALQALVEHELRGLRPPSSSPPS